MQKNHRFAALGPAGGMIENAIFGDKSTRLLHRKLRADYAPLGEDKFAAIKREYAASGELRDEAADGFQVI